MPKKIFRSMLYIVSVLVLPLLILLTSMELITFNVNYYKTEYEKHDISKKLSIEESDLMDSTAKLLDYLRDDRKDLDFKAKIDGKEQDFFSSRDKMHMVDVKNLFIIGRIIRNVIFIVLLLISAIFIYNKNIRFDIGNFLLTSSIVGVLPIVILVILINIDFYKYFTIFHEIFFTNDLWLLDPNADRLVNIFPESFFFDTAIKIIMYYLIVQLVLFILSMVFKYFKKQVNAR
ncbi:MAG: TIGR01906 family membrane protein [Lutispora sp.]|nr:TIGR01906 family membrane protein [Lutispora sp.]